MATSSGSDRDDPDGEDFFKDLRETDRKRKRSFCSQAAEIITKYLDEPVSKSVSTDTIPFGIRDLFIKLNTPIPSSAAVERLFSLAKDVLRPKRSNLTDGHFEMAVFLKGCLANEDKAKAGPASLKARK